MKNILTLAVLTLALFSSLNAAASVTATVDRSVISEFDLLTLTIRVTGDVMDQSPDFSAIERDFEIINSSSQQSSSISIINGRQSRDVRKDYILTLRAKKMGRLTIPPITLGNERSDTISVLVQAQSTATTRRMNQYVFFETSVDTTNTYVQSQIIYTVKLFYSDSISGDFPPPPKLEDAVIETLENERRYESIVDNRRFYVLEKQYAVFPQKSGTLTFPRETFVGARGRGGLFSSQQRVNAVSESHSVTVKTLPKGFPGANWLPAKQLTLSESWATNPPEFRVGEPVNRILTMTATGLAGSLLPPFEDLKLTNAKTYADPAAVTEQAGSEGVVATNSTTIGIVPTREGKLVLPEIKVPWWNTQTDKLEVAIIPAASYNVLPALGSVSVAPAPTLPGKVVSQPSQVSTITVQSKLWLYVSVGLLVLWLLTLWQWWSLKRQIATPAPVQRITENSPDQNQALKALLTACKNNDASYAHKRLLDWGRIRFPQLESLQALPRLAHQPDLAKPIHDLEVALYGTGAEQSSWQGAELLQLIESLNAQRDEQKNRQSLAANLNPT